MSAPRRQRAATYIADQLEAFGVTHVFMVPAVLRRTLAEIERRTSITAVHTHGEKSAAYMADGYARVAHRPAVCMAQQVGALNLAAGIRDAALASSPVVAFTGGSPPLGGRQGLYQAADDLPAFDAYTKHNQALHDVTDIAPALHNAFRTAASGNPGPVHLQFEGQEGEIDRLDGVFPQVVPLTVDPAPSLDLAAIREIADRLTVAERPIIFAGGGVLKAGAGDAVRRYSAETGIPVATSLSGRGTIAETDPLAVGVIGTYSRKSANRTMQEADVVLILGSSTGSMVTNFWRLPADNAEILQIDIDPEMIGRNYPVTVGATGDLRFAVEQLAGQEVPIQQDRDEWHSRIADLRDEWLEERQPMLESDAVPIRPERLCSELTAALPDDGAMVVDTGHAGMWMASMFEITSPNQRFIRSSGHLGWAFSAALGGKCADSERPVIAFTGDLGFWYHIAEIETAVRHRINTVTVVNNNHSGNQSRRGFTLAYDGKPTERSRALWVQREVNFAAIANEIGALGFRVEHPDEIGPALRQALAADEPVIIDVVTDIDAAAPLAWDADGWVQRY
ncbi:MAG: thiamine pyrophosphate-binding protein [Acidimicrobiaceae bacterium]|nr:thiamine pyrophosphate-binding protein [Acidimicrobiaceae bacterium]MBT5848941.1 thiamine pyrophosphate-binding protein [Acidimicrobiaceae bacterium]